MDKVKKLVLSIYDIDVRKIVREARIIEDLGFDSLRLVELIMAVEDDTEESIPDEYLEYIVTLGDIDDCLRGIFSIEERRVKSSKASLGINLDGMQPA